MLPLSQLGGYVLGARAAILTGVPAGMAFASTIVDVTLELLGQIAYTALGIGLLMSLRPQFAMAWPVIGGLGGALAATVAFVMVQRHGLARLEHLQAGLAGRWLSTMTTGAGPLYRAIQEIYRRPRGLWAGWALHLAAWIALAGEAWLALHLLGAPRGFAAVIILESLVYALRSLGFAIPNALGVQEGSYVMVGALLAVSPEMALALSLLKRARDIAIGVPTLLLWQAMEARRLNVPGTEIPPPGD